MKTKKEILEANDHQAEKLLEVAIDIRDALVEIAECLKMNKDETL